MDTEEQTFTGDEIERLRREFGQSGPREAERMLKTIAERMVGLYYEEDGELLEYLSLSIGDVVCGQENMLG